MQPAPVKHPADSYRLLASMPMNPERPRSRHFLNRRQILQIEIVAALPAGFLSCTGDKRHQSLIIVGLPGTCNPTLPSSFVARAPANATAHLSDPQSSYPSIHTR